MNTVLQGVSNIHVAEFDDEEEGKFWVVALEEKDGDGIVEMFFRDREDIEKIGKALLKQIKPDQTLTSIQGGKH